MELKSCGNYCRDMHGAGLLLPLTVSLLCFVRRPHAYHNL
jgi:hypothetical protein